MQKIRYGLIVLFMLICSVISAQAEVSIGIGLPSVSIGINLPLFPELVPVPGYPVYYAPRVSGNYFFYDGMYWVYQDDNWYASSWYNGPWGVVEPEVVPLFVLRVPVSYYRQPPVYFRGWRSDAPPRWGQHWGHGWEQRRGGWDRWNRGSVPSRAPLPVYQRRYSGDRYPRQMEQQNRLRSQSYRYQPHDRVVREHFQRQGEHGATAPAQRGRQDRPEMRSPRQPDSQRPTQHQQGAPAETRPQQQHRGGDDRQRSAPAQAPPQQRGPSPQDQRQQRGQAPQQDLRQQRGQAPQQDQRQQHGQAPQDQRQQRGQAPQPQEHRQQPVPAPHDQRQQPGAAQREQQQAPRAQGQGERQQDRGESQERNRGRGQEQNRDEGRGRDRNN